MNLTDAASVLGAPAAVLLFMWLNREKGKSPGPEPIIQKLDVLIAKSEQIATDIAILKDRSDR